MCHTVSLLIYNVFFYCFKQKLILVSTIIVTVCCLLLKGSSAWFLDNGEETRRDPQPLPRSHRQPNYRRHKPSWRWRRKVYKPKTTAKPMPVSTTTATPPGPEFCRNHTLVFHVKDEPGPVVCLRKNATELMTLLKGIGGFIKRYTAVKVMNACGFEDLTSIENVAGTTAAPSSTTANTRPTTTMPIGKRQVDQQELQRRKRSLPTSPGTVFRGCQGRGTIPDGTTTHRLCTECAATTRLGNDQFPTYINEVVCRDTDFQCAATMGLCFQRSLQLPFLRSTGNFQFDPFLSSLTGKTVYKEIWVEYTQEIRSCCECQMYPAVYNKIATRDD